jgi:uncharacterized repeat protein (TIGR01451 family)
VGQSRSFSLVALVDSAIPDATISNTARVSSGRFDPNLANNISPAVVTNVTRLSDLVVTKTVNKATPDVEEVITYTVKVRNAGPSQATGVVVTDVLPSGMTFVDADATQGSYDEVTGLWTVDMLAVRPAGQEQTLTIRARPGFSVGGQTVVNTATASSNNPEPPGGLANSTDSDSIVPQKADLKVFQTSVPISSTGVTAGERLTYTLTISNPGPSLARSVVLTDVLPGGVSLLSATAPIGRAACVTGSSITCNVGDMNAGAQLNYRVVITRPIKGLITNTVTVDSLTPDPIVANNAFTHTITVNPAAPHHLAFVGTLPTSVLAGEVFTPVVEILDRFDNTINAPFTGHNDTIELTAHRNSSCTDGISDSALHNGLVPAINGVASFGELNYTRSIPTIALQAVDNSRLIVGDCSDVFTVNSAATAKLVITSDPRAPIAGTVSQPIVVERRDEFDNVAFDGATRVDLSDSSPTGVFSSTIGTVPITFVTISEGETSAGFYYTDTIQGDYFITVTAGITVTPDSQLMQVRADDATELFVVTEAPDTTIAGVRSGEITIQRRDQYGNPNFSDPTITVTLDSDVSSHQFFNENLNDHTEITRTTIVPPSAEVTFRYRSTLAGDHLLTFDDDPNVVEGTEWLIEVVPAATDHLVFTTTEHSIIAGQTSPIIGVAREDEFDNRVFEAGDLPVVLASSSISGTFNPASPVTITQGSDYVTFDYYDELAATHHITASADGGVASASQELTVTAATAEKLVVITLPQNNVVAGLPSGEIIIQRQDQFGNPAIDDDDLTVVLTSTSSTYDFLPLAATTPLQPPSVTLTDVQASFRYSDTTIGSYEMVFDGGTTFTTTQPITIVPAGPYRLFFTQAPITATAGLQSDRFVVELQDEHGNPTTYAAPIVVNLNTNSPGVPGFNARFVGSDGISVVTSVQIPTGVPTTTFYYQDRRAGTHLITADESGLPALIAATGTITVVPQPAHHIAFTLPAVPITAGITSEVITVQIRDQFNNPVTPTVGAPMVLNLSTTPTDPNTEFRRAVAPLDEINQITITNGTTGAFRYYDERAGTPNLVVDPVGPLGPFSQMVTVHPAAADRVTVETAANGSGTLLETRNITAGHSITVHAVTRDEFGNYIVDDSAATWTIVNEEGGVTDANLVPVNMGRSAVFSSNLVGSGQIQATRDDVDTSEPSMGVLTVVADDPVELELTMVNPAGIVAGEKRNLGIRALDQYGNLATQYENDKTLIFSGPLPSTRPVTAPGVVDRDNITRTIGTHTVLNFVEGVAQTGGDIGDLSFYHAQIASLRVTDTVALIASDPLPFTVEAALMSKISIDATSTTFFAGEPVNLTLSVEDAFGNLSDDYDAGNARMIFASFPIATATNISPTIPARVTNRSGEGKPFGENTYMIFRDGKTRISDLNGVMTIAKAGTFVITVDSADAAWDLPHPSRALTVTVLPRELDALQWSVDGPQTNGEPFTNGTITALDMFGNIIKDIDETEALPVQIDPGSSLQFTNKDIADNLLRAEDFTEGVVHLGTDDPGGVGMVYTGPSGLITFTATSFEPEVVGTVGINFLPGPLSTLSLSGPITATAGTAISVMLTALDGSANPISGTHEIRFTGAMSATDGTPATVRAGGDNATASDTRFGMPLEVTFANGTATVSLFLPRAMQNTSVQATIGGIVSNQITVDVGPAPLDGLVWSVTSPKQSGVPFGDGTLSIYDEYSNVIPSPTGPVTITQTTQPTGTLANNVLVPGAFVSGVASLSDLTYTGLAGPVNLRAAPQTGPSSHISVTIVPGPPVLAQIRGVTNTVDALSHTLTVTAGHPISLSLRLFDSAHNLATNFTSTVPVPLIFTLTPPPTTTVVMTDAAGVPLTVNGSNAVPIHFNAGVSTVTAEGHNGVLTLYDEGVYTLTVAKDAPDAINTDVGHALVISVEQTVDIDSIVELEPFAAAPGTSESERTLVETPSGQPLLSELGATVWLDANRNGLQESDEGGVEGVQVELYKADGSFVNSMATDATGQYRFTELEPGPYYVEFATMPGHNFTQYNAGDNSLDAVDSDPLVPWLEVGATVGGETLFDETLGEALIYTLVYTNTDAEIARPATNVIISTTVPAGTSFAADMSHPGWRCTGVEAGEACTLTVDELPANTTASTLFAVRSARSGDGAPESLDLRVSLTQSTLARTEVIALGAGETNLTVNAGLVRTETTLYTSAPAGFSELTPDEPQAERFIFLPQVASEE